jgi:hypothetical protein
MEIVYYVDPYQTQMDSLKLLYNVDVFLLHHGPVILEAEIVFNRLELQVVI